MNLRVLVVDDEQALVRATARALRACEFAVTECYDVATALMLLANDPPDVVLSDYQMPDGGGPRVLAEARRLHIPLVFYSAAQNIDYDRVVTKPASIEELRGALTEAVVGAVHDDEA